MHRKRIYNTGLRRVCFASPQELVTGITLPESFRLSEDDEENELLRSQVASGQLVAVRMQEAPRTLHAFELEVEPLVPEEEQAPQWIELTLLDGRGHPFPEQAFTLTMPSGDVQTLETDERGTWRLDDTRERGTCRVQLSGRMTKTDRQQTIRLEGGEAVAKVGGPAVGLRIGRAHTVVVKRPPAMFSV